MVLIMKSTNRYYASAANLLPPWLKLEDRSCLTFDHAFMQ